MSNSQFPKNQQIHVMDTGEKLDLGGFQPADNGELRHVPLNIYKHGVLPSSVKLKMGLHLSTDFNTAFAISDSFFLTSVENAIEGTTKTYWLAVVRFDFGRINLNKNQLYYFSLQSEGYTRNADTFYIGAVRDYQFPIYTGSSSLKMGYNMPASKSVIAFQEPK